MIPWASPLAQYRSHEAAILAAVRRVLDIGNYIGGAEVARFEAEFAAHCGAACGVGVNSGTDALLLALKALGVGPGDEIVTVSHTALATIAAVVASGATPVLVDVDPVFYTLDPTRLAAAFTERTKAIIVVHLYGQSVDMDATLKLAEANALPVIEDCAQAAGALYEGRRLGSLGVFGCFSFYPTKNLGAIGDGGMVVTDDVELGDRVRRLRQYGWDDTRTTMAPGINSRLDELQAAILAVKLPSLDAANARRAEIARHYTRELAGLPLTLPAVRPGTRHVHHLYVVACDERDELKDHLESRKVMAGIHYAVPAHRHRGYSTLCRVSSDGLPVTEALARRVLTLPMYPELMDTQVDEVISAVRDYYRR